jgi:L-ascorbate oxidase
MLTIFVLLLFIIIGAQANQNVRYYEFNITQKSINPDCSDHVSPVFLINNQLPGPTIQANQGDQIKIKIRNQLKPMPLPNDHRHHVAIHFHGIRQYGSNHADGVPFLTQSPISPGDEYTQEFRVVNQAGTYFYHAHVGLQEETVFGPIIIYESNASWPQPNTKAVAGISQYDDEKTILLSEWWHRPHLEFEKHLLSSNFTFIPEAQSILINGRTLHDPRHAVVAQCGGYESIDVQPNKIYRLRVIGATTFRTLGFAIAHHNLTIIEVDGELTKPYTVNELEVAPGQRFSVLLHTDRAVDDYSIQVVRRWSDNVARPTNGLAILQYKPEKEENQDEEARGVLRVANKHSVALEAPMNQAQFDSAEMETPNWHWPNIQPLYGIDPIVYKPATRTIKLRSVDKRLPDGSTRWFVNGVAFSEALNRQSPILHELKSNRRQLPSVMTKHGYDPNLGTYPINYFDIVDIVFQTTHLPHEPCRSHPWHTHGHSHWEIANGAGEYNDERDGHIRNIKYPIQKDITMVYPVIDPSLSNGTDPVGCGWSKVRILAVSLLLFSSPKVVANTSLSFFFCLG